MLIMTPDAGNRLPPLSRLAGEAVRHASVLLNSTDLLRGDAVHAVLAASEPLANACGRAFPLPCPLFVRAEHALAPRIPARRDGDLHLSFSICLNLVVITRAVMTLCLRLLARVRLGARVVGAFGPLKLLLGRLAFSAPFHTWLLSFTAGAAASQGRRPLSGALLVVVDHAELW